MNLHSKPNPAKNKTKKTFFLKKIVILSNFGTISHFWTNFGKFYKTSITAMEPWLLNSFENMLSACWVLQKNAQQVLRKPMELMSRLWDIYTKQAKLPFTFCLSYSKFQNYVDHFQYNLNFHWKILDKILNYEEKLK